VKNVRKGKGFTLVEILSVVVVLAVLGGVAIPAFSRSKDKAEANQAIAYLRTLRTAERLAYARNGAYACQTAGSCDTAAEIKSVLFGTEVSGAYAFIVTATATTFLARARKGSTPSTAVAGWTETDTICVNEVGGWSGLSSYKPAS